MDVFVAFPFTYRSSPQPRVTHPVRIITDILVGGDWDGPRETAYSTEAEAITDLDYTGTECEDIVLLACEGTTKEALGF